jgi:hypothetical protein
MGGDTYCVGFLLKWLRLAFIKGPKRVVFHSHQLNTETNPVSKTLWTESTNQAILTIKRHRQNCLHSTFTLFYIYCIWKHDGHFVPQIQYWTGSGVDFWPFHQFHIAFNSVGCMNHFRNTVCVKRHLRQSALPEITASCFVWTNTVCCGNMKLCWVSTADRRDICHDRCDKLIEQSKISDRMSIVGSRIAFKVKPDIKKNYRNCAAFSSFLSWTRSDLYYVDMVSMGDWFTD